TFFFFFFPSQTRRIESDLIYLLQAYYVACRWTIKKSFIQRERERERERSSITLALLSSNRNHLS
ncbi:MAG: hypothetical protein N7Q72_07325, partial [Spiroplasma sp. Tabriz.8]|nr:hypothetical protein [Spiroplasma sp. Tabriz.8]